MTDDLHPPGNDAPTTHGAYSPDYADLRASRAELVTAGEVIGNLTVELEMAQAWAKELEQLAVDATTKAARLTLELTDAHEQERTR